MVRPLRRSPHQRDVAGRAAAGEPARRPQLAEVRPCPVAAGARRHPRLLARHQSRLVWPCRLLRRRAQGRVSRARRQSVQRRDRDLAGQGIACSASAGPHPSICRRAAASLRAPPAPSRATKPDPAGGRASRQAGSQFIVLLGAVLARAPFADGRPFAASEGRHAPIAGSAGAAPVGLCREDGY